MAKGYARRSSGGGGGYSLQVPAIPGNPNSPSAWGTEADDVSSTHYMPLMLVLRGVQLIAIAMLVYAMTVHIYDAMYPQTKWTDYIPNFIYEDDPKESPAGEVLMMGVYVSMVQLLVMGVIVYLYTMNPISPAYTVSRESLMSNVGIILTSLATFGPLTMLVYLIRNA